jgi:hypothetical protein
MHIIPQNSLCAMLTTSKNRFYFSRSNYWYSMIQGYVSYNSGILTKNSLPFPQQIFSSYSVNANCFMTDNVNASRKINSPVALLTFYRLVNGASWQTTSTRQGKRGTDVGGTEWEKEFPWATIQKVSPSVFCWWKHNLLWPTPCSCIASCHLNGMMLRGGGL